MQNEFLEEMQNKKNNFVHQNHHQYQVSMAAQTFPVFISLSIPIILFFLADLLGCIMYLHRADKVFAGWPTLSIPIIHCF